MLALLKLFSYFSAGRCEMVPHLPLIFTSFICQGKRLFHGDYLFIPDQVSSLVIYLFIYLCFCTDLFCIVSFLYFLGFLYFSLLFKFFLNSWLWKFSDVHKSRPAQWLFMYPFPASIMINIWSILFCVYILTTKLLFFYFFVVKIVKHIKKVESNIMNLLNLSPRFNFYKKYSHLISSL